ncbi:MAG TPA: YraN family protein [Mariniflexile sp.]
MSAVQVRIKSSSKKDNRSTGAKGEMYACRLLESQGYRVISKNYKTVFAEIDLITLRKGIVYFVEVKTRKSTRFGLPQEVVGKRKLFKIKMAGEQFIKENKHSLLLRNKLNAGRCGIVVVALVVESGTVLYSKIITVGWF